MTKSQNRYSQQAVRLGTTLSAGKAIWGAAPGQGASPPLSATLADGSRWNYAYDAKGEVVCGAEQWSDGVPAAGEQFQYTFDDMGNRTGTLAGGDQTGANLRAATYTANSLNEYTSRTVPAAVDILGGAGSNTTVTVNNQATYRNAPFYEATLALTNTSAAVWQAITNLAVAHSSATTDLVATVTGNTFLQQTPEAFSYDSDGNLTQDGRWSYTWDGENRLIQMVSLTNAPTASKLRLTFAYDSKWRRISKAVEAYNGTSWITNLAERFVYDGWNLLDEQNATNNAVIRSYMWGLDLSGTMQGAGGVGGLISVEQPGSTMVNFATYDCNGNLVGLIDSGNAQVNAAHEYGPFGELLRATGPMAFVNPFRFSTKYQDDETAMLYYGYRYYDPPTGRWFSKDPIGEGGGVNLYNFCADAPLEITDIFGLAALQGCPPCVCKKVNYGSVPTTLSSYPNNPSLGIATIGLTIPYAIQIQGLSQYCHCKYTDNGTISGSMTFANGQTGSVNKTFQNQVTAIDCSSGSDTPGFQVRYPPTGFNVTYTVNYSWSGTVSCESEFGPTLSDSVNVSGSYLSSATWRPGK